LLSLIYGSRVFAQGDQPQEAPASGAGLEILWPTPISEVWDVIDVIGTANVPNMEFYRLEIVPLNPDLTAPENATWIPITADFTTPVVNGVLAPVDTRTIPDGLYAMRLVMNVGVDEATGTSVEFVTGPIRVNNGLYYNGGEEEVVTPPPAELDPANPYVVPAPLVSAVGMRYCDLPDEVRCPVVDFFDYMEGAALLGVSTTGSGWLLVENGSGLQGWVSPTETMVVGDTSNVPLVVPPQPVSPPVVVVQPPPAPAAPALPPSPPTINGLAVQDPLPECGRSFTVHVNVANQGSTPTAPGTVKLQNRHRGSGKVSYTGYENYPPIPPGGNYVVVFRVKVNRYGSRGQELRASTAGSRFSTKYDIQRGRCRNTSQARPPSVKEIAFAPGQCELTPKKNVALYSFPHGSPVGVSFEGRVFAEQGVEINKMKWYRFDSDPGQGNLVWIRDKDVRRKSSGCGF
jgi:hypothetical protein